MLSLNQKRSKNIRLRAKLRYHSMLKRLTQKKINTHEIDKNHSHTNLTLSMYDQDTNLFFNTYVHGNRFKMMSS